jgi:succinyl-CoA synthetase alpha subunit
MIRQLRVRGRSAPLKHIHVSSFSTSARHGSYEDTIANLKIGAHTRVIFQGFTGRDMYMAKASTS